MIGSAALVYVLVASLCVELVVGAQCAFVDMPNLRAGVLCAVDNGTTSCIDSVSSNGNEESLFYRQLTNTCCGSCHPMYCNTVSFEIVSPSGIFSAAFIRRNGMHTNVPNCTTMLGFCAPEKNGAVCSGPWVDTASEAAEPRFLAAAVVICGVVGLL